MNLQITYPLMLALLPLCLIPLLRSGQTVLRYPWLELVPRDWISDALGWGLRIAAAAAIAALVLGLAGLHRAQVPVERVGRGAQIVLLLDRSSSMDESFTAGRVNLDPRHALSDDKRREIKGAVARRFLAEFAAKRTQDMFAMVVFSASAMRVLDFTQKPDVIQAAIKAAEVGRGLSETDIALGLLTSLSYFDAQPYTGSRIVLLVSDGGARIDPETQRKIAHLMKLNRVALYWIYLRSLFSPELKSASSEGADDAPEQFLHKFFSGTGSPYRAYEADDPDSLRRAIEDVNRLENLPLTFTEIVPKRELSRECYAAALLLSCLIIGGKLLEIRSWR